MSKHDDGGPAFPSNTSRDDGLIYGMSLRDYFAAKALPIAESRGILHYGAPLEFADLANWAYHIADAMLKARQS
jgi:hypothetical protein